MTAYVIAVTKKGKPTLYRSTEVDCEDTYSLWKTDLSSPEMHLTTKAAIDLIEKLLLEFDKGNGHPQEKVMVGKVREQGAQLWSYGSLVEALLEWTPVGEKIEADFQISLVQIHLETVQTITPEVNVTRNDPPTPPKPSKLPNRAYEWRDLVDKDIRYREYTYTMSGEETAKLRVQIADMSKLNMTFMGTPFHMTNMTPSEFVTQIKIQNNL